MVNPKTKNNPKGAGRTPGAPNKKQRGVRITPTISQDNKDWLEEQKEKGRSYGKVLDGLMDREREKEK